MTDANTFVRELLTDGAVLPRARAMFLARIMCRADIVAHLAQHGRNVRAGRLPAHMEQVFVATERSLMGLRPSDAVTRATRRHEQTGVKREQQVFIWAVGVDAYLAAGRLAGHRPSGHDLLAYHAAATAYGRTFGVVGGYTSVDQIEALASRLLNRIVPGSVPAGGWASVAQVMRADWFRRDSTIPLSDVAKAVEETTPPALLAALRGR